MPALLLCAPREARANGDEVHAESFKASAKGLGATTASVGLAGRRPSPTAFVPITSADLVVDGLPTGATVEKSFLYWVTFGASGHDSIVLGGTNLTSPRRSRPTAPIR